MNSLKLFRCFLSLGLTLAVFQGHSSPVSAVQTHFAAAIRTVHETLLEVMANAQVGEHSSVRR